MTPKKIYGPWIEWHGGECPVPPDTLVEVRFRGGGRDTASPADRYYWKHERAAVDIVEYRIVTEQADLDAAEKLLRDNGYTITPPAKPLTFEDVVPMTEVPPKDARYWVVYAGADDGAYEAVCCDDKLDSMIIQRRMAYLDKEHALIAARHIFGLKGGEL